MGHTGRENVFYCVGSGGFNLCRSVFAGFLSPGFFFGGRGSERLYDTSDDEIVELLLVTAQVGGMYPGGDNAVAVIGILSHAEVVAAGGFTLRYGLAPFAVVAQYLLVALHEPPHPGGNGVLKHHRIGDEFLGVEGVGGLHGFLMVEVQLGGGSHQQAAEVV